MLTKKVATLFNKYLSAFKAYDLDAVVSCYHLPCTLHTPDKIVLVNNTEECRQEFSDIFSQLKQLNTVEIIARKASYMAITDDLLLVCIDWGFIDGNGQVFAGFCAYYHLSITNGDKQALKIVNVVSHELSNSLSLPNLFELAS